MSQRRRSSILSASCFCAGLLSASAGFAAVDSAPEPVGLAEEPAHAAGHVEHADESEHGAGHHHVPHFSEINWFYGLIGEKEGVPPSLLWRPPGMPVPLGALLVNTAILFFLIGKFGGPAISGGLSSRKKRIAGEILAASKMKEEAEDQLAHYEGKLQELGAEMDRIKEEMRAAAEKDRERILAEAKEYRQALEVEARQMVSQELAHARHEATLKAVSQAVDAAREQIRTSLTAQDHERLASSLLSSLHTHLKGSETKA